MNSPGLQTEGLCTALQHFSPWNLPTRSGRILRKFPLGFWLGEKTATKGKSSLFLLSTKACIAFCLFLSCYYILHLYVLRTQQYIVIIVILYILMPFKEANKRKIEQSYTYRICYVNFFCLLSMVLFICSCGFKLPFDVIFLSQCSFLPIQLFCVVIVTYYISHIIIMYILFHIIAS